MTAPNTTADVNDPTAEATEAASVGKTEAEIETANGEQVGDRLGDTPVEGVEQTRNGIGELLTQAATPVPVLLENGILTTDTSPGNATHTAIPNESVSTFRRLLDEIEGIPREVVEFFEARFGHHAAA